MSVNQAHRKKKNHCHDYDRGEPIERVECLLVRFLILFQALCTIRGCQGLEQKGEELLKIALGKACKPLV